MAKDYSYECVMMQGLCESGPADVGGEGGGWRQLRAARYLSTHQHHDRAESHCGAAGRTGPRPRPATSGLNSHTLLIVSKC